MPGGLCAGLRLQPKGRRRARAHPEFGTHQLQFGVHNVRHRQRGFVGVCRLGEALFSQRVGIRLLRLQSYQVGCTAQARRIGRAERLQVDRLRLPEQLDRSRHVAGSGTQSKGQRLHLEQVGVGGV